ncbi:MAG: FAD-binding oxidoreductase, partial [Vulcanisaeta sp.]
MSYEERADFIGFKAKPIAVVYPYSEDDVINIVKLAREFHIPIVPWGAGTSLTGAVACDGCILIDMRRMNKILEINTVDWYVRVQPGAILDDLNKELNKYGFFFPPDPASHHMCTIGGIIATDAGGMRAVKYGTVKDWVLALRVVLPSGDVIKVGEPLRKNRAGYDLVHLFVGSEGTLGIITEAWLRIMPLPRRRLRAFIVYLNDMDMLAKFVYEVRSRGIVPELMEYMDYYSVRAVNEIFNAGLRETSGGLVFTIIEDDYMRELIDIASRVGEVHELINGDVNKMYEYRSRAGEAIKAVYGNFYSEDITVPISRLVDAINKLKDIGMKYGKPMPILAHIGDGNMHPHILFRSGEEELAQRIYDEVARIAIELGGTISGEHGIGIQKKLLLHEQYV